MVRRPAEVVRLDIVIPDLQDRGPPVRGLPVLLDVHFRALLDPHQLRSAAPPNLADASVSTHSCAHAEQPSTRARVGAVMGSVVPHQRVLPRAVTGGRGAGRHALRCLYVRVGGRIIPVPVEKILQCEARGDYVALHTADGCYVVNTSVEYLAERLSPESFVRIHRSRIVTLEAVQAFERHADKRVRARLPDGTTGA